MFFSVFFVELKFFSLPNFPVMYIGSADKKKQQKKNSLRIVSVKLSAGFLCDCQHITPGRRLDTRRRQTLVCRQLKVPAVRIPSFTVQGPCSLWVIVTNVALIPFHLIWSVCLCLNSMCVQRLMMSQHCVKACSTSLKFKDCSKSALQMPSLFFF